MGEVKDTRVADEKLMAEGLWALAPGQCVSVIVGTDKARQRGLHCCAVMEVHGHKTHRCGCGCGQSWRYLKGDERWSVLGPLTDVVLSS